ncbi:hypothetical protein BKA80DRAFT_92204 [Phyllosticta citrichinensis]
MALSSSAKGQGTFELEETKSRLIQPSELPLRDMLTRVDSRVDSSTGSPVKKVHPASNPRDVFRTARHLHRSTKAACALTHNRFRISPAPVPPSSTTISIRALLLGGRRPHPVCCYLPALCAQSPCRELDSSSFSAILPPSHPPDTVPSPVVSPDRTEQRELVDQGMLIPPCAWGSAEFAS